GDAIRGAMGAALSSAVQVAYAVLLDTSPNAIVDSSAICDVTGGSPHGTGAGGKVQGNAAGGTVRRNNIVAFGGSTDTVGVWADPCRGAAPWVFDNFLVVGTSNVVGSRSDGVRAVGACNVRVDSNRTVTGGVEQAGQDTNGVYCATDPST